ncbi:GGDEF domain-containing protein [Devosia sp. 2618]|uniref:GGDEF domain-containing protein n=1 Tax=Devosia sp. 2618 TaxID=3156454 RepID=UPI0033969F44
MIDNASLVFALAFATAAMMLTLFISWLNARQDSYLRSWAAGMALVIVYLAAFGMLGDRYDTIVQLSTFSMLVAGMALIYVGTCQFRTGIISTGWSLGLGTASVASVAIPLIFGYSGIGTMTLNLWCGIFMLLSGREYWLGRKEAPLPLILGSAIFVLTSLSFFACCIVLLIEGHLVLTEPPSNWAEQVNSIMAIIGVTCLGALSITMGQSRATRRHRDEALTDSMTGLLNRRALFDRFDGNELSSGIAVLMFDIDHFKQINDRQGHAGGDAVIRHFALILLQNLRPEDIVARIGGEEFCAILPAANIDYAKSVAESVRADLEASPAVTASQIILATVSVGVATSGAGESFSSVLNRADDGLYKAKGSGRNRVAATPMRLIA